MALSDILIISSIIASLVSIPFLVTGPLSDTIPTGRLVLNMNSSDVEGIPSKMSKIFSSEKFEKTYETAFGKFTMSISAGEIKQELSKPGKVTVVNENTEETVWKITTQEYQLEVTRTPNSVEQICTTPDGELIKIKETGEVTESFQGMNQEYVLEICAQAEQNLQEEVNKMEQIKSESEIPSTESSTRKEKILINEFVSDPESGEEEWIELYNPTEDDIDLTDWTFESHTGSTISLAGKIINSTDYLILNKTDYTYSLTNSGDTIILRENGDIIDQVAYGNWNDGNINDNAPKAPKGNSTARVPNGVDTNNDEDDFAISILTPGASND